MKALSLALLTLVSSLAWGDQLRIAAVVATDATQVHLGDIATIDIADMTLEGRLRAVKVGAFAPQQKAREISGDAIRVRLDLMGFDTLEMDIPKKIKLVRSVTQLPKSLAVADPPLVRTVERAAPVQRVAKPAEQVVPTGVMLKSNVAAGELITANDLTVVTFKRSRNGLITSVDEVVGKRALRHLRHRTLLRADMVGSFDVVAGDRVKVQAKRKGFVIESLAMASQNGVAGEFITVSNPRTRRAFSAKVIGSGLVEVVF